MHFVKYRLFMNMSDHVYCRPFFSVRLVTPYCKAISMEWMTVHVQFFYPCTLCVFSILHDCIMRLWIPKEGGRGWNISRPSKQEDYHTYIRISRALYFYMLPLCSYLRKTNEEQQFEVERKQTVVLWTDPTFISVSKFMAQIWWSDCKLLEHMHKSIAA